MVKTCFVSIDIEQDLGSGFRGVESLDKILNIFKKYNIPATLFVTGEGLQKYPEKFQELALSYEIASHGFTHQFWNTLSPEERAKELDNFISLYRSVFKKSPVGFRAPSHVIDEEATDLLAQTG